MSAAQHKDTFVFDGSKNKHPFACSRRNTMKLSGSSASARGKGKGRPRVVSNKEERSRALRSKAAYIPITWKPTLVSVTLVLTQLRWGNGESQKLLPSASVRERMVNGI